MNLEIQTCPPPMWLGNVILPSVCCIARGAHTECEGDGFLQVLPGEHARFNHFQLGKPTKMLI